MTKIDTSGAVDGRKWSDLTPFTQGYIEALFATFRSEFQKEWGVSSLQLRFSDLAPETLAQIISDCEKIRYRLRDRFADGLADPTEEGAGRAFWKLGQKSLYADFPLLTAQLGDDGKVRLA